MKYILRFFLLFFSFDLLADEVKPEKLPWEENPPEQVEGINYDIRTKAAGVLKIDEKDIIFSTFSYIPTDDDINDVVSYLPHLYKQKKTPAFCGFDSTFIADLITGAFHKDKDLNLEGMHMVVATPNPPSKTFFDFLKEKKIKLLYIKAIPTAENIYNEDMENAKARYREAFAERMLKTATKTEVFLLNYDGMKEKNVFAYNEDDFDIAPYGKVTSIISKKEISKDEQRELLDAIATQIRKKRLSSGAFCHLPIHGIKVYSNDQVIFSSSFCWECYNFGFSYPSGSRWTDTSEEMKTVFLRIMPIPQSEIDRFNAQYKPEKTKKSESAENKSVTEKSK